MMTKKLGSVAVLAAVLAACADPAAPVARTLVTGVSASALNPVTGYPFPHSNGTPRPNDGDGWVTLCKISNIAGTFNFDVAVNGAVDGISDLSITIGAGQENTRICLPTPLINSQLGAGRVDVVNIVEVNPGAGSSTTIDIDQYYQVGVPYHVNALLDEWNVAPRTAKVYINDDLEKRVTFNNTLVQQNTGCTYTKGWYRNKNGSPTVLDGVDGVSKANAQKIFAATPGKPGQVSWGSDNLLLNLYQQFLAALNNLGGDANYNNGPAAVGQAITDVRNGTTVTGLAITTTLTHDQMAALVATLSAFNEGSLAGWPHCRETSPGGVGQ